MYKNNSVAQFFIDEIVDKNRNLKSPIGFYSAICTLYHVYGRTAIIWFLEKLDKLYMLTTKNGTFNPISDYRNILYSFY